SVLGQEVRPLARVGLYIPGGRAAYPSTVLMTAVPARVAGVPEIVLVTPPGPDGLVNPVVLAAARIGGGTEASRLGGAQAIAPLLDAVATAVEAQLAALPRREIARASLAANGALVLATDLAQAVEIANALAPEHLELQVADPERLLPHVRHAGAIFLGCFTPEVIGDYVAGPNHVLPTAGTARFSSPLGTEDFVKR